jgi:phosphinothricin acetyltransferase
MAITVLDVDGEPKMDMAAFRPAAEGDLDAITAIYADAVLHGTSSYELDPPSRAEMAARFASLAAGNYP